MPKIHKDTTSVALFYFRYCEKNLVKMGNEASTLMNELQTNIESKLERLQPNQINTKDDAMQNTCPAGTICGSWYTNSLNSNVC